MPGRGGLPPVEVIEEGPESRSERVVTSGGRRMGWWALVAVVLLAVGVARTTGADRDRGPDDDPRSSTGEVIPDEYVAGLERSVFGAPVAASVLIEEEAARWRILRLATGRIEDVPALDGAEATDMVPVRGGVVVREDGTGELSMVPLPPGGDAREAAPVEFPPGASDRRGEVVDVLAAGTPDRLWILSAARRAGVSAQATLVNSRGRALVGPFDLSVRPLAGTEVGLVYNAGGRVYLVAPDGVDALGHGTAHGASATSVGRVACDHTGRCRQELVDVRSGAVIRSARVTAAAASRDSVAMAFSDTGVLATVATFLPEPSRGPPGGDASTTLYVTDAAGPPRGIVVDDPRSPPAWLPDGEGVLLLTGQGLIRYAVTDGRLVGERGPSIAGGPGTDLLVIPDGDP